MYIHTYIRIRDAGVIYMHIMYISYRWGSSSAPPASLLPYPAAAYCINKKIQKKNMIIIPKKNLQRLHLPCSTLLPHTV